MANTPPPTPGGTGTSTAAPAASAVPAGTGTAAAVAVNPNAPRFGGMYPGSTTVVWIGGPPLDDFSGTFLSTFGSPLAIRGLSPESEIKAYSKRVLEGYPTKFKRDDPDFTLLSFSAEALSHMQATGMDTVFYMTGVDLNGQGGLELFTYHSRFTKAQVTEFVKTQKANGVYDYYATQCLKESAFWLINSLDESLKRSIRPLLASEPTGPEVWMLIVSEVTTDSLRRVDELTDQWNSLTLAMFKGENVREYAEAAYNILIPLDKLKQLPRNHLLNIVDHMALCTVMDFKIHWMAKRASVSAFVTEATGKHEDIVKQMPNLVTYTMLIEEAKTTFANLQKQWGPLLAPAKQDPMVAKLNALQAKLDKALQAKPQEGKKGKGKGDGCWKCGKKDHLKKDCPEGKGNQGNSGGQGNGNGSQNGSGKWAKPKDGEPHEKMVNGVKKHWCEKCGNGGRWNNTHKTAQHVSKAERDAAGDSPSANLAATTLHSTGDWFT